MIDVNIASDYRKIGNLFQLFDARKGMEVINELLEEDAAYGNLTTQFNLEREFDRDDLLSLLLYMGFVTMEGTLGRMYRFGMPNYVIRELYYRYLYEDLVRRERVRVDVHRLEMALVEMAYEGRIEGLVRMVEDFLGKVLSNRDMRGFREGHLKVHILTLLHLSRLYYVQSELEVERGYVDVFLRGMEPFDGRYEWVLELKYVRGEDLEGMLARVKEEGRELLRGYMDKVRPQARYPLRGALMVFTGQGECAFWEVVQ